MCPQLLQYVHPAITWGSDSLCTLGSNVNMPPATHVNSTDGINAACCLSPQKRQARVAIFQDLTGEGH